MQVNPDVKVTNRIKIAEIIAPLGPVVAFFFMVCDPSGVQSAGRIMFYFIFPAFFSYLVFLYLVCH
jgi:hypothetical protein